MYNLSLGNDDGSPAIACLFIAQQYSSYPFRHALLRPLRRARVEYGVRSTVRGCHSGDTDVQACFTEIASIPGKVLSECQYIGSISLPLRN